MYFICELCRVHCCWACNRLKKFFLCRFLVWRTSVVHIIIIITIYLRSLLASRLAPIKHVPLMKCQRTENEVEIMSTVYIDEIVRPSNWNFNITEKHYVPHTFSPDAGVVVFVLVFASESLWAGCMNNNNLYIDWRIQQHFPMRIVLSASTNEKWHTNHTSRNLFIGWKRIPFEKLIKNSFGFQPFGRFVWSRRSYELGTVSTPTPKFKLRSRAIDRNCINL